MSAALREPARRGAKLSEKVQLAAGAKLDWQVVVNPKSPVSNPESEIPEKESGASPLLVTVTVCDPLAVPTF
jgi:hypothetical protein